MRLGIGLGIGRGGGGPTNAQRIAREAVSPTQINTWHIMGSSRMDGANTYLLTHCDPIPWSGVSEMGIAWTTTGHRATVVALAGGSNPTTSIEIGGTQNWFPTASIEVVSLGAEPTIHLNATRITNVGAEQIYPLLYPRLALATVRARWTFRRHAGGVDCSSDPATYLGPRAYIPGTDLNSWVSTGGAAAPYTTDTTGTGYGYAEAVSAAGRTWAYSRANWATDPARTAFPEGQILAIDPVILRVNVPGVVLNNISASGATLKRWTIPAVIADEVFTDLLPLKGDNHVFVIEVSIYPGLFNTYAEFAAQLDATVARCLTTSADATFIVHTAYPSSLTGGINPEWCQWVEAWCRAAAVPVLYLPTHDTMSFEDRVAVGFYSATSTPGDAGDSLHAGPLGRQMFAEDIGALIAAAAV